MTVTASAAAIVLSMIRTAMELYAKLGGQPIDLEQLAKDCGVELTRIDSQLAKDEAAEDEAAGG